MWCSVLAGGCHCGKSKHWLRQRYTKTVNVHGPSWHTKLNIVSMVITCSRNHTDIDFCHFVVCGRSMPSAVDQC